MVCICSIVQAWCATRQRCYRLCVTTETRPLDRLGQLGEFEQDSNTASDVCQRCYRLCVCAWSGCCFWQVLGLRNRVGDGSSDAARDWVHPAGLVLYMGCTSGLVLLLDDCPVFLAGSGARPCFDSGGTLRAGSKMKQKVNVPDNCLGWDTLQQFQSHPCAHSR